MEGRVLTGRITQGQVCGRCKPCLECAAGAWQGKPLLHVERPMRCPSRPLCCLPARSKGKVRAGDQEKELATVKASRHGCVQVRLV